MSMVLRKFVVSFVLSALAGCGSDPPCVCKGTDPVWGIPSCTDEEIQKGCELPRDESEKEIADAEE